MTFNGVDPNSLAAKIAVTQKVLRTVRNLALGKDWFNAEVAVVFSHMHSAIAELYKVSGVDTYDGEVPDEDCAATVILLTAMSRDCIGTPAKDIKDVGELAVATLELFCNLLRATEGEKWVMAIVEKTKCGDCNGTEVVLTGDVDGDGFPIETRCLTCAPESTAKEEAT